MAKKVEVDLEVKDNSKSLKAQLREAQAEVIKLSDAYGATSKEAAQAAKRAAELKDAIGDAKALTDAFNPDAKFNALSSSIGGVLNGFQAFEGALGIIGVEGEAVQQTLLKVQSAMALSQGLQGLGEAKDSFVQLGSVVKNTFANMSNASKVFLATGIGLLITGIATAIAYADDLKEAFGGANYAQEALKETTEAYNASVKETTTEVDKVGTAFELAKEGVISKEEALQIYNDTLGDSLGTAKDVNEAEDIFIKKKDAYVQAMADRAIANELFAKAAQAQADSVTAQFEDQTTALDTFTSATLGALGNQTLAIENQIKAQKRNADNAEKENKRKAESIRKLAIEYQKNAEKIENANGIQSETEKKLEEERQKRAEEARQKAEELRKQREADLQKLREFERQIDESRLSDYEREILATQRKYDEQFKIAKKYGQDLKALQEGLSSELNDIEQRRISKELEGSDEVFKARQTANLKTIEDEDKTNEQLISAFQGMYAEKDKQRQADELKEQEYRNAIRDITYQGLQLISDIAELFGSADEKRARKAFKIQKALSLTDTGLKTVEGVQNAYATAQKSPLTALFPAYPFIQAGIAGAFGAVQIAKIAKSQYGGSVDTSTGGGSGVAGATGATATTPNFNIVGQAGANQLSELTTQKVYVVGSEVTTQQQLDRERIQNATF